MPSLDGRFRPALHGGRAFDSAPGLAPALASEPMEIAATTELLSNTTMEFDARVPTVEVAVVIKAFAYASRRADRDIEDIYRLAKEPALAWSDRTGLAIIHSLGNHLDVLSRLGYSKPAPSRRVSLSRSLCPARQPHSSEVLYLYSVPVRILGHAQQRTRTRIRARCL